MNPGEWLQGASVKGAVMRIRFLLLLSILVLHTGASAEEGRKAADSALRFAGETGSRLAYTRAMMLHRKGDLQRRVPAFALSDYGLKSNLFGGSPVLSNSYSRTVRFITGGRAVDETLQLDTIGSRASDPKKRVVPIEEVESLQIKSHPWKEMLSDLPKSRKASAIFELVPHDHFVVYFESGRSLKSLEQALDQLALPLSQFFALPVPKNARRKVMERLGLERLTDTEEFAFLSEDLDFYPGTHYAVILNSEVKETNSSGKIGQFWVAATSPRLFQRIKDVSDGNGTSMMESLDFQYAHAVVDQPRDGFVYLSENFILKMVSPQHRLNSARRMAAVETLVSGQYLVWAYRSLTGRWPESFAKMHEEKMMQAPEGAPLIGEDGLVRHQRWGSLYDLRALSDLPIERVTEEEKELYDTFRKRYQQYWTNFFDPVGIGIRVGDRVSLHTIILPLIDNSDYRQLTEMVSGEPIEFDSLRGPSGASPLSIHSRINYNDVLMRVMGVRSDQGFEDTTSAERARFNREINRKLKTGEEPVDVFTIFGDEACFFTVESELSFPLNPEKASCLAIELNNVPGFRKIVSRNSLGLKTEEADGRTFYKVPFLFGSYLYATYVDNFLCLTAKEEPMQRLCEELNRSFPGKLGTFHGADEIGSRHHVLFRSDFSRSDWLASALASLGRDTLREQLRYKTGYLGDRHILSQALKGTSHQVDQLLRPVSLELLGVPLEGSGGQFSFGGVPLSQIHLDHWSTGAEGKLSVIEILGAVGAWDRLHHTENRLQWLTASLDFTPEGLSTHLLFKVGKRRSTWF